MIEIEKKDTILLLLVIGSIMTIIFGIVVVSLGLSLVQESGGIIALMAMGVIVITTIIFPMVIIIFNVIALKALDSNKNAGTAFGIISIILCMITILFCIFYMVVIGLVPGDVANIVAIIRGFLVGCIVGQIIVLIGLILNFSYQSSK